MTAIEAAPPIPTIRDQSEPGSIVVVEPEAIALASIRHSLEAQGHHVVPTSTLREALEMSEKSSLDLVVLDVDVSDGRDWAMLQSLQSRTGPVVLITPIDDDDCAINAMQVGVCDLLPKPIRPVALVARVESALTTHRLRHALEVERRKTETTAGVDALTGMHARSRMEEFLAFTAAAAARYGYAMSVVLMDIDHLGRLGAVHGSDAAQRVLAEIADHLAADLRSSDIAGRWDDDEFLVLLPHTDIKGAALFAERLRMTFAEMPIPLPNGTPAVVSASFGCAQGTDVSRVVELAQDNVIAVKRSGRNAVKAS